MNQASGTADIPFKGQGVGALEHQCAVVGHVADNAAGRAAGTDLERAVGDDRAAGIGVGAGEFQAAGAVLGQATGTADESVEDQGVGAVKDQRGVVRDVARD